MFNDGAMRLFDGHVLLKGKAFAPLADVKTFVDCNVASCQFPIPNLGVSVLGIGNIGLGNIFTMATLNQVIDKPQSGFPHYEIVLVKIRIQFGRNLGYGGRGVCEELAGIMA